MPLILRIRPTRGGRKMLLSLDDGTYLRIQPELVEKLGFAVGTEVTPEEIEMLCPAETQNDPEKAREQAARFLSRRPLSEAELLKKLLGKGFSEELAEGAVAHMKAIGFLDDGAYAEAWVQEYVRRGLSARAMAMKLREKGLSKDTVEEAIFKVPPPDDVLDALVASKAKGQPLDRNLRQKIFNFLYRRGFASADIQSALQRYGQNDSGEGLEFE